MQVATERQAFIADAVFIPNEQSKSVDPDACIMLMVDGDNNSADVFTEESWSNDGEPFCRREWGNFTVVTGGRIELLPELWVVKIDEREYWCDQNILDACPRMYGVYVFDRKEHFHICSFEPCYELHFLGTQYEETDALHEDEYRRDEINGKVLDGDVQTDQVTYWGKADIDRMLTTEIREGCLPPVDKNGGYQLLGTESVTTAEAIEEAREAHQGSEL